MLNWIESYMKKVLNSAKRILTEDPTNTTNMQIV